MPCRVTTWMAGSCMSTLHPNTVEVAAVDVAEVEVDSEVPKTDAMGNVSVNIY